MLAKSTITIGLALALALLSACAPKVKSQPGFAELNPRNLAVLPPLAPQDIGAARLQYIQECAISELKNRGFYLVDQEVVDSFCVAGTECAGLEELQSKFAVDAFVRIKIADVARSNFGLGFYNAIEGSLELQNVASEALFSVSHTESERGGVVFDSGQIFQGIKEQIANSGDSAFNKLANNFTHALVAELPRPTGEDDTAAELLPVNIRKVSSQQAKPGVHRVCLRGSPHVFATLIAGTLKTNLRELEPGHYCGVYRLGGEAANLSVELRSVYGNSVRKELALPVMNICDISDHLDASLTAGAPTIALTCNPSTTPSRLLAQTNACPDAAGNCAAERVLVYRSKNTVGPYRKVGELRNGHWRERMKLSPKNYHYYLVTVAPNGEQSAPIHLAKAQFEEESSES